MFYCIAFCFFWSLRSLSGDFFYFTSIAIDLGLTFRLLFLSFLYFSFLIPSVPFRSLFFPRLALHSFIFLFSFLLQCHLFFLFLLLWLRFSFWTVFLCISFWPHFYVSFYGFLVFLFSTQGFTLCSINLFFLFCLVLVISFFFYLFISCFIVVVYFLFYAFL